MAPQTMEELQSNQQAYHHCFIGHTQGASWRETFEQVCEEVLPHFGLQPWYADKHFQGGVPLREKVVKMIATTRYGIYDLSFWRENEQSVWIMPRNVLIELGMAIALNRPMLLLRHANNRESGLPRPFCLEGVEIGEFGNGKKLLKQTLHAHLPFLTRHTPQLDWLNRYCHFGAMQCSYRESHPQAQQWGKQKIHIHIADGTNTAHIDESEFRDMIEEEVITRFNHLEFNYLDSLTCPQGCQFLLCSRCQEVRTSPFAIYRITPHTSADTFIAIGMSIALEKQFNYAIPKILITEDERHIPSLLKGYEIIVERSYTRIKDRLNTIIPEMIEEIKRTTWKPQPLPFEVFLTLKEYDASEEFTHLETNVKHEKLEEVNGDNSPQQEQKKKQPPGEPKEGANFDDFTDRARNIITLAQEEARRFQHDYVDTEHLLLGLVRNSEGIAARILTNYGIELNKVRYAVEFIIGRGDHSVVLSKINLSPRTKKVIELARDEARRLNHQYIDPEHLLLGIVREGESVAAGILENLGVNLERLRTQTFQRLSIPATETFSESEEKSLIENILDSNQIDSQPTNDRDRFDKFTKQARMVFNFAQEEALRFQHNYVGTEHLLLGIVRENKSGAARVLADHGIDLNKVRSTVEFIIGRGDRIVLGEIGLTPRAKKVIELAVDEARRLNHQHIDPKHLLLAIARKEDCIGAGVLESLGVNLKTVYTQTLQLFKTDV